MTEKYMLSIKGDVSGGVEGCLPPALANFVTALSDFGRKYDVFFTLSPIFKNTPSCFLLFAPTLFIIF
jgi:hypothetical protein